MPNIQLSGEKEDISYDLKANHILKDKIVAFDYYLLPVLFIGGAISSIAWELDLPDLFGPYSEPLWLVVSSFLAIVFLSIVIFSTYAFMKGVFQKTLSGVEAIKFVFFILFFVMVAADFINETGFLY